ncbi:MAG TPA: lysophospholipid acyltransferase family protein [Jiangellales bacterium]|nr:lysophospholipid acyltransferase family protein [Jiangellales bacterium]
MARFEGVRMGFWYHVAEAILRPLLTLVAKRDWRGRAHLPRRGGIVVVTNHLSHLDPLTLAHYLFDSGRLPRFLGKESVFRVPVVGYIIDKCGQIRVYRESSDAGRAMQDALAAVRAGECVVIYPEGTITRDPDLWPMSGKTGAARVALATGCPVVPVAQWGVQEVLAPYGRRLHVFPRRTVRLQAGPPVDLDDLRGAEVDADVLAVATERIMAAVTTELVALRGGTPPAKRFDARAAGVPVIGNPRKAARSRRQASGDPHGPSGEPDGRLGQVEA